MEDQQQQQHQQQTSSRPLFPLRHLQFSSPNLSNPSTLSPMTDLAFTLGGLNTGYTATPKRRISWSSDGTPTPTGRRHLTPTLSDPGTGESPLILQGSSSMLSHDSEFSLRRSCLRKSSLPVSISPSLETFQEDVFDSDFSYRDSLESMDSGYSGSQAMDKFYSRYNTNNFIFPEPSIIPSNRKKVVESPLKNATVTTESGRMASVPSPNDMVSTESGFSSWGSNAHIENDDGFLDVFVLDSKNEESPLSSAINELIQRPLSAKSLQQENREIKTAISATRSCLIELSNKPDFVPQRHSSIRNLFCESRTTFKRPEPPQRDTPVSHMNKRRKAVSFCVANTSHSNRENIENVPPLITKKTNLLQRCHSETEATIMKAVQRSDQNPDLIGDYSKPYTLPLIRGQHEDLKTIDPLTVMQLINGEYSDNIDHHVIVDCRYPYEYEAGHIKGAKNIYSKEGVLKEFFNNSSLCKQECSAKRSIIVFHCEFSSERGPSLSRFLRNRDRDTNKECYPNLHYPEIYLLNGGYKAFFEVCKELCEPQAYKPMLHKDHEDDLKRFRAKSKSWSGETKGRVTLHPGRRAISLLSHS